MDRLEQAINGKERWVGLYSYIELIKNNIINNPNASLDGAKSVLESISKTILSDKGIGYKSDEPVGNLVKQAFSSLPIFINLSSIEAEKSKAILNAFATVSNSIGSFRNEHGFFAHGQDLESEKFDSYLLNLAISSSDLLASFLIISHTEDLKDRSRIYYEENKEFNKFIDDREEDYPSVLGVQILPSKALFSDTEGYKANLLDFTDNKSVVRDLLSKLKDSGSFVNTRSICAQLLNKQEYFNDEDIREAVLICANNHNVYSILGHGYTKNFFTWILEEKYEVLSEEELNNFKESFNKKKW